MPLVIAFNGSSFGVPSLVGFSLLLNVEFLLSEVVQIGGNYFVQEAFSVRSLSLVGLDLGVEVILERDGKLVFETVAPVGVLRQEFHSVVETTLQEVL